MVGIYGPVTSTPGLAVVVAGSEAVHFDEHLVQTQVVPDGVLEAVLVGSEAWIPLQDPFIDLC